MQRPMAKRDQEDAQEFLGYLLDHLHEELLSLKTTLKDSLQLRGKQMESGSRLLLGKSVPDSLAEMTENLSEHVTSSGRQF